MKGKILGRAKELVVTEEQYTKLQEFTKGRGGHQSLCQKVYDSVKTKNGKLIAVLYEAEMERINKLVEREDEGSWQGLFRDIMKANQ